MKKHIINSWIIYSIAHSFQCFAGSDPVSWQLTPASGLPVTAIGNQSTATYTLTSHLPGPAVMITSSNINGSGLIVEDGCNNVTLNPGGSCFVVVRFTPTSAGTSTYQLTYGYHNNRIPLPQLRATATGSQPDFSLSGVFPNFPVTINPTGVLPFSAVFTNTGRSTLTNCFAGNIQGNNQLTLNPTTAALLTLTNNSCGTLGNRISLAPNASCEVNGTLSAPYQAGNITLSSLVNCDQASTEPSVTSTILQPAASLSGVFTEPTPFPASFNDNEAPFVTAKFTNNGNIQLTNCRAGTATGFSINPPTAATINTTTPISTCGTVGTPISLNPGDTCFLYGHLTNLVANNPVTLDASVICNQANATPQETFSIVHTVIPCTDLTAQVLLPFPANTYKYADNVIKFEFQNACQSDSIALGAVSVTPTTGTATIAPITASYDTCSNQTLTPGSSCTVTASVIPTSIGNLGVSASTTINGGPATASTSTSSLVATNQQATHHVLFVNQCNFDVWYGIANGDGSSCPGTACKTPDPNLTTFPGGAPTSAYHLPAQILGQAPSTIDLATASYQNGAFWPRTGCAFNASNQFVCATGTCATMPNSGSCNSSGPLVQPQSPYTKFEANLNPTAGTDGVYDVSAINGMTVPVEVKAFGPFVAGNTANTVYICSGAGAIMQPTSNNNLGNCTWNYNPSSTLTGANVNNDFYWVTHGADDACTTSALPNLCGMAWGSGPDVNGVFGTPINRKQGAFLGFNTLDVYAAYTVQGTNNGTWGSENIFTKYGLDIEIPGQSVPSNYGTIPNEVIFPGNTFLSYYALIGCPAVSSTQSLNSCYQTPTNNDYARCCGCVDWGNTLPEHACGYASGGAYTAGMNLDWTTNNITTLTRSYTPEQAVTWIKDACPTAYSYTYDDASSSFTCTQDGATNLQTSYQVTFCPGGLTGLPAGATEGRSTAP